MDKLGRGNRDLRRAHHRDELATFQYLVALEFHVELLELVGLNLRRRDPVLHVG
jgi:hypothetical protein